MKTALNLLFLSHLRTLLPTGKVVDTARQPDGIWETMVFRSERCFDECYTFRTKDAGEAHRMHAELVTLWSGLAINLLQDKKGRESGRIQ